MNKLVLCLIIVATLSGCADSVSWNDIPSVESVGFLHGLWHGLIVPISFMVSLFDPSVAIYATYNTGGWYDFGFLLGVDALGATRQASS